MVLAEVTFYNVVLFFHIAAVVLAFGPTYAYGVFQAAAMKHNPRAIPAINRGIEAWNRVTAILLVVIIAAGLYLVEDGGWSYGDFYISFGFAAAIIMGGLIGAFFNPKTRQITEVAERDVAASGDGEVEFSEEFNRLVKQTTQVGTFAGLLVLVTIYVMTAKPF
ncbi:MAG TPA: DUF2269 family protein [Solirubrobacterales bacterium]|nr:DUF2269 family protein [Solirubrobacterales bacterium]